MNQQDADALATTLVFQGHLRGGKVAIFAADANRLLSSEAGRWDRTGLYAFGTLADGRRWRSQAANSWGHTSITVK